MPDLIVRKQDTGNIAVSTTTTNVVIQATPTNSYVLPPATASTLGGVKIGGNLSIDGTGLLSANIPPGGVESFNNRTGNVTLTANDVTAVANGVYILDSTIGNVPTFVGSRVLYGQYQTRGQAPAYPYVSGSLGTGSTAMVGVVNSSDPCNIEFWPGDVFNQMRFRSYNKSIVINDSGFEVETGTANWTWSANSILTQGRGDARYQPVGSYLTSANLTWSNLTGKPTFATVATSGSYTDLANTPNLSLYYLANNPSGYITAACLTYGNITGTPNLSLYQLVSTNTWANLTGTPTLATVATSGNYSDLSGTPNLSLYPTLAANNSFTGCNTFNGQINCNSTLALSGNLVTAPKIQAYSETANAPAISSGNLTLNLSLANVFGPVTLNANISNLTISNPPANGTAGSFTLLFKANGTAFTVTWPAAVKWAGGTAPTLTSTANKTDIFTFVTTDGGTNYYGFKAGQNF